MKSSEAIKFLLENEQFTDISICVDDADEKPVTRQEAIKELTELDILHDGIDMRTTRGMNEQLAIYINQ